MSKRHICRSKFQVRYLFLDIYENPRRKNFINLSCAKHSKIIEIKNDKLLFLYFLLVHQKAFIFLRHQRSVKKKIRLIFPLIYDWNDKG